MSNKTIEITGQGEFPLRLSWNAGESLFEVLRQANSAWVKQFVAARSENRIYDFMTLASEIKEDSICLSLVEKDSPEGLDVIRHSCAHIMAAAVRQLFGEVRIAIGPRIVDGFYYDFDLARHFAPEDFASIEKAMKGIIQENPRFEKSTMDKEEARSLFKDEPYKLELIEEIADETVSVYKLGGFTDLCRGPHVPQASFIKAFKVLSTAGAYWRGDEKRPMLQRLYGTAFPDPSALEEYVARIEEAKKRDHRKLGKQLELFSISDQVGPGLVLWHPKGALVRSLIEDFWRAEHRKAGYDLVYTPHIAQDKLWEVSGHLHFYKENMYAGMKVDGVDYLVKPMNCPYHVQIYNSRLVSYRELPLRYAELGTVYRYERSGVMHGLFRVRGFTQDDAHIFTHPNELEKEVTRTIRFCLHILNSFGFTEFKVFVITKPQKYVGTDENWERATDALINSLNAVGLAFEIDPGEGVFYGPKIDIKIKDSLQREWQCSTIQVDFNLPDRFSLPGKLCW
jgi:threonyl-tRNA synthetase